jgi:gas vesicle protein
MTTKELTSRLPDTEDILGYLGLATQRSTSDTFAATAGAFTLGLIVGAAVALLYAPRSGQETRRDVGERLTSVKDRVSEAIAPVSDAARSAS